MQFIINFARNYIAVLPAIHQDKLITFNNHLEFFIIDYLAKKKSIIIMTPDKMTTIKVPFELKDIATYRSELMGWAITWIMMLHFTFIQIKPLGFIAQYGFAGVDIFMMVSGLGLYFSLDKDNHIGHFYRKRLVRIFPTYYILGIIASFILYNDTIIRYLFRYSTIGFWIGGPYWEWYVPSIVALYLIAPFLKKLIDERPLFLISCLTIIIWGISYIIVAKEMIEAKEPHFFLLYRIPTFIFGMICAYWIKIGTSIKCFYIIMLLGVPCFVFLYPLHHEIFNYKYFSMVFLLPLLIFFIIIITKSIQKINPIIIAIGKASLEIYLIQSIIFHAIDTSQLVITPMWHDTITVALIISSILLGIFSHWIIEKSGILHLF